MKSLELDPIFSLELYLTLSLELLPRSSLDLKLELEDLAEENISDCVVAEEERKEDLGDGDENSECLEADDDRNEDLEDATSDFLVAEKDLVAELVISDADDDLAEDFSDWLDT